MAAEMFTRPRVTDQPVDKLEDPLHLLSFVLMVMPLFEKREYEGVDGHFSNTYIICGRLVKGDAMTRTLSIEEYDSSTCWTIFEMHFDLLCSLSFRTGGALPTFLRRKLAISPRQTPS